MCALRSTSPPSPPPASIPAWPRSTGGCARPANAQGRHHRRHAKSSSCSPTSSSARIDCGGPVMLDFQHRCSPGPAGRPPVGLGAGSLPIGEVKVVPALPSFQIATPHGPTDLAIDAAVKGTHLCLRRAVAPLSLLHGSAIVPPTVRPAPHLRETSKQPTWDWTT